MPSLSPRRHAVILALAWLSATSALLLSGCQTPATPAPAPDREARLQALGFAPADDGWTLNLSSKLLFAFDSDALDATQRQHLLDLGNSLAGLGIGQLRIEGHTDLKGGSGYNLQLSQRRAEAVAQVLHDSALSGAQLTVRSRGKERPVCTEDTDACQSQNRRVVLIVPAL
ncbi:OmpA family protein [Ideonella oryzae]|uniref:OmpA family protein n=1 Tax=Ideonella oryzae TaxID=2937441 RepID=A0ABT1BPJ7_9BURK|nr:OmpA family protein [Ideonella oryzae]MCO5978144.1 OmpA family protein [Ideonella oryzae]